MAGRTRLKAGQRYLRCAGSLGWAFPATIGAKAALPDKPVIGFAGDAGFYYHMAELETAARLRINMVIQGEARLDAACGQRRVTGGC